MSQVPPTLPFRLAAAYGVPRPNAAQPVSPATTPTSKSSSLVAARVSDSAEIRGMNAASIPSPSGSLAFYRNPAEKNAAATGVASGKVIDVEG